MYLCVRLNRFTAVAFQAYLELTQRFLFYFTLLGNFQCVFRLKKLRAYPVFLMHTVHSKRLKKLILC
jgi:hypothetical protein